jgi:hypothetical protein
MRRSMAVLSVSVLLALSACAKPTGRSIGGSTETGVDGRRLGIYEAVIRSQIEFRNENVWIFDRICGGADGAAAPAGPCPDRFSAAEQEAIVTALTEIPHVEFVDATGALTHRIFDGTEHGQIVRVGPIVERDGHVEVEASHYCGNVCAGGSVWAVEPDGDGWRVTGPAPGHGVGMA